MDELVVEATDVVKHFRRRGRLRSRGIIRAVDGVDLSVARGRTTAIVGESGSGKSTLARVIVGLVRPDAGRVLIEGEDLGSLRGRTLRRSRQSTQLVFQDPHSSLDPRMSARASVAEPWQVNRMYDSSERAQRADELLQRVGLTADLGAHYPHQLSGGEAQRVAIARALALEPRLLVLDEPVSALDVSVQAQVLELLRELQEQLALSYLFISHDLAVVDQIADSVAVMYSGRIVESGPRRVVLARPAHPYTRALLSASTVPAQEVERSRSRLVLRERPIDATDAPGGCRFRPRCWKAEDQCARDAPALDEVVEGHEVACHFPEHLGRVAPPAP